MFAIDVGEGFQFVDAEGNPCLKDLYKFYEDSEKSEVFLMKKVNNDYWEIRDYNLNLIYENIEYKDYLFGSFDGEIINFVKIREDYTSKQGDVCDDVFLKKTENGFVKFASFSRDDIKGYVHSGDFYNGKFLIKSDAAYQVNGIDRAPLYISPEGEFEYYAYEEYISVIPRYIGGDSTTGLVLVNPVYGEKYTYRPSTVMIFDRDTDTIVPNSLIILTPYYEEYYNWSIYDFTNDFVLAKIKKEETGEVKYVAFDKYTGKFVYEIKADIYFDYDTDIWLIENDDGQWALMHKNGTIITDWYYDCSGFNGNVALVKKTEESPITVIGLELDNGKYNVIDYSSNYYYGDRASYSGVGNYFNITNGDDSQLVCVRRNI